MERKKIIIIIVAALVICVAAYFFFFKKDENSQKWDTTKGTWTADQRDKALANFTEGWFPHIIAQKWDCVKQKDAEKLLNDSIYQTFLSVQDAVKKNGKTSIGFPVDTTKTFLDLKAKLQANGVYDIALEDAKKKLN